MLDTILLVLASFSMLLALLFGLRVLRFRSLSAKATYGVAHQERRQAMLKEAVRGVVVAFVGLILFGLVGLSPRPIVDETLSTTMTPVSSSTQASPSAISPTVTSRATNTVVPSPTHTPSQPATATSPAATPTPTQEPTITMTPAPATAVVNSEVGVWLREIPSVEGEQLEWLLDGTVLTLLPGVETTDELEWQQVISPDGTEGWVATPFIFYGE